jgi:gamma-polyglutamate synthase
MASNPDTRNRAWRPSSRSEVEARLDAAVAERHPKLIATEAHTIARIGKDILSDLTSATDPESQLVLSLCQWIIGRLDNLENLRRLQRLGEAQVATAGDSAARRLAILDFARSLGATPRELRRDSRAFRRWFELDAVSDRAERRKGETELDLTVALGRLAAVAKAQGHLTRVALNALRQMNERILAARLDDRSLAAALDCLGQTAAISETGRASLSSAFSYQVSRLALDKASASLVSEAALSCLCDLVPESGAVALVRVLERDPAGDVFWVQRACVRLAASKLPDTTAAQEALALAAQSTSAAVRQAVAIFWFGPWAPQDAAILALAISDPDVKVRLAALRRLPDLQAGEQASDVSQVLLSRLKDETEADALRLLFELVEARAWTHARAGDGAAAQTWADDVLPLLSRYVTEGASEATRGYVAAAHEGVWCAATPQAFDLHETLTTFIAEMTEGSARRLSRALSQGVDDRKLAGRVLSVLARRDFGLSLERAALGRVKLRRGERFGLRLWRILHELRNPGTDKRQAFRHTIGRINAGKTQAPSGILAELSQTKVPGEPLFIETDQGWRNYLPLLDLVISSTQDKEPVEVYSPHGVTRIVPPGTGIGRWLARLRISRDFAQLAEMRNASTANSYLVALAEAGIEIHIRPHAKALLDPAVKRHFPVVTLPIFPGLEDRWQTYIYSIYQNTLGQLAVFMALALAWFLGRHYVLSRRIRKVRRALPLVIGGWGTRGKSGTERLKAAMFNGLGLPLISKTTGCEAMFLHADAYGETKELFLFRPFDKATIWEQARVARMGRDMGSGVVLWECMGLTPSYVAILQRQWMRDDISTITNTYPDHEDLQGPAGRNIPEVMTEFIPDNSTVLTTEEQMLPILAEGARRRQSRMIPVDWCAPLMLPDAALSRFPYAEHPANIALVLRMAEELGLDQDRALREMSDRVVPDLGVLKTYPVATVGQRRIEFVNGMSANERFGALGNWRRTDFATHDFYADPSQFLVTVVNNRGDRVPRSRVFAQILVDDFIADAHLLIGSNLQGMQGYIDEALVKRMRAFELRDDTGRFLPSEVASARITEEIRRLRVPYAPEHLAGIASALAGRDAASVDPERLAKDLAEAGAKEGEVIFARQHLILRQTQMTQAQALLQDAERTVDANLEERCRETFTDWYRARIHIEPDTYASGDEVVARLVRLAPPNMLTRAMGIQNIKGTGLGFIYKWQDYDQQTSALREIASGSPERIDQGLRKLETGPPIAQLGRDAALTALADLDAEKAALTASASMRARSLHDTLSARVDANLSASSPTSDSMLANFLGGLEGIADAYLAIRRRKRADRVYVDLAQQRIGRDRAAQEIQALNAEQKGGWLLKRLSALNLR